MATVGGDVPSRARTTACDGGLTDRWRALLALAG
jgi:hypothetical protein